MSQTLEPDTLAAELQQVRDELARLQTAHDGATGPERDSLAAQISAREALVRDAEALAGKGVGRAAGGRSGAPGAKRGLLSRLLGGGR